jgi:hypothetical protein
MGVYHCGYEITDAWGREQTRMEPGGFGRQQWGFGTLGPEGASDRGLRRALDAKAGAAEEFS